MLTYEKDVVPVKMTAREAHKRSVGTEEDYIKLLIDVYNFIHEEVNNRNTSIDYWIDSLYLADRVFNELVKQGYNVNLEKDMGADKVWHLSIEWKNVDLDPNKKYILPMEGTEEHGCLGETTQGYAYKNRRGIWTICHVFGARGIMDERVVTAKDIEEAPEWVKAIEPVEVEE
ncbi:hypothetical protein CBG04_10015 [Limosilactobacillus reuteri]|uniref:hypothetical protein n=1 Tax=Limosilactobacillus reuteri TaxID=1598 RepID=UPI000B984577|nr:hypothetical protein [Limosilactobacillus reuteri]OYS80596.1 hypothetical protein CBG11_07175 [Limosilactobacillus reuteri]OYS81419.1 hypothetical protein CBG04_10015 [Limosilactobacillus reuteri]OYS83738.1 hypothetical protein CBG14_07365 [Limosilactobacillus reuteri]